MFTNHPENPREPSEFFEGHSEASRKRLALSGWNYTLPEKG